MNKRNRTYRLFCIVFAAFFMFSPLQSVFAETVSEVQSAVQTEESVTNDTTENDKTNPDDTTSAVTDENADIVESEAEKNSEETNDTVEETETEPADEVQVSSGSSTPSRVRRAAASTSAVTVSDLPVNIYDYNVVYNSTYNEDGSLKSRDFDPNAGINKGHSLIFRGSPYWNGTSALNANTWINSYWPESGSSKDNLAVHGIVESTLVNGYPMTTALAGGESLEYLYTPNDDTSVMEAYSEGVTGLFNKQDNHYWFNSDDEDVTWDKSTNSFTKLQGNSNRVKFLPFNTRSQNTDYEFGMSFTLDFEMPYDESETVDFTFSGDDDVWVFVDDTLLLDVGGIHGATGGTIDFKNRTVTYTYNPIMLGATSKDVSGNKTVYSFDELGFTDENAFAAGSDHQLKFFYNERGEGLSNCYIDFNLPLMVETTIDKEVYAEEDKPLTDNSTYSYYLMYQAPDATEYTKLTTFKENYKAFKTLEDGTTEEVTPGANGEYSLKVGESITYYMPQGSSYYLVEIQPTEAVNQPLYTAFQNDEDTAEIVVNSDKTKDITQTQVNEIDSSSLYRSTTMSNYKLDGRETVSFEKLIEGPTKLNLAANYTFELALPDDYPSSLVSIVTTTDKGTSYSNQEVTTTEEGKKVLRFTIIENETITFLLRDYEYASFQETSLNAAKYVPSYDWKDASGSKKQDTSSAALSNLNFSDKDLVEITNTQVPHNLTVKKEVTGNVGNKTQKYSFTIKLEDDEKQALSNLVVGQDTATNKEVTTNDNGEVSFSLADGESYTISIPEGVTYTIKENTQLAGYTTTSIDDLDNTFSSGDSFIGLSTLQDRVVTFTNEASIAPATSMNISAYWPVVIGLVLILGVIGYAVKHQINGNA